MVSPRRKTCGGGDPPRAYDVLCVPRGASYRLAQAGGASRVIVCRAPAGNVHPVFHARWEVFSRDQPRSRHLQGKDVFFMFDVSESADKLITGYTLFQPGQRSWPRQNPTDQEEVYIFLQGRPRDKALRARRSCSWARSTRP